MNKLLDNPAAQAAAALAAVSVALRVLSQEETGPYAKIRWRRSAATGVDLGKTPGFRSASVKGEIDACCG